MNRIKLDKDSLILKGSIFDAAIPFNMENDICVFSCYNNEKACDGENLKCWINGKPKKITKRKISCDECNLKPINGCKGIVENIQFEGLKDIIREEKLQKDKKSCQINYVNKFKIRPYLILSSSKKCLGTQYSNYVWGAPIKSIKAKMLSNESLLNKLKNNEINGLIYIDQSNHAINRPSLIDIINIKLIHKSNLLDYRGYIFQEELYRIQKGIEFMLDLKYLNNIDKLELLEIQKKDLEDELKEIESRIYKLKNKTR